MPLTVGQQVRVPSRGGKVGEFKGHAAISGFCAVQFVGESTPTTLATADVIEVPKPARLPAWLTED